MSEEHDESNDETNDKHDGRMVPNRVTWAKDTPAEITSALMKDERTCFREGTAIHYEMSDMPPFAFGVWFCPAPYKHAHASLSAHAPIRHVVTTTVLAYTFALALDRGKWEQRIPEAKMLVACWEAVVAVCAEQDARFGEYLRSIALDDGPLGSPMQWTQHFENDAWRGVNKDDLN